MKIQSRPAVKQACEPIVEAALKQMCAPVPAMRSGRVNTQTVISLDEHERNLEMIMNTLRMTKVITHYEIGATRETKASTYENTEWLIRIKFTDDPTKKAGYVADLLFNYTH